MRALILLTFFSELGKLGQQGSKLVGTGVVGTQSGQGQSVALSGDGNTAIVGGWNDNAAAGAAWVYTRSNGVWTQQGAKLVGTGALGAAAQGSSVALSADGNTAIVGGYSDNPAVGAAWVYTRSNGVWTQQGSKLVGTGAVGSSEQGLSVALSADGNTAIVGGPYDNGGAGAAWAYTRSNGVWTQQGNKLVGTGALGAAAQGSSVALSADGNTAIMGGPSDEGVNKQGAIRGIGAAWVFTRSNGVWTQKGIQNGPTADANLGQSVALSGDGNTAMVGVPGYGLTTTLEPVGAAYFYGIGVNGINQMLKNPLGFEFRGPAFGSPVALSADGSTAIVGGMEDVWVFAQPVPCLQVTPATNMVTAGNPGGPFAPSSFQYQLSASIGSVNFSISGVPNWLTPSSTSGSASTGTTVTFTVNTSANSLAPGTYGPTTISFTNTDTGQGTQTLTATLTVNPPALQVTPTTHCCPAILSMA